MTNTGIILALAYPDTIVRISDEKFVPYLKYINIGTKDFVRAGHAALVLIEKKTGHLEYFDFGRYTSPLGYGRVRGELMDNELTFPFHAEIVGNNIKNLNAILVFLATHPKFTHGEGKLVASVCDKINYEEAKSYIMNLQSQDFVRYGAFIKKATNCSRFVTDTLISSVIDDKIKKRLIKSKRFTPSTVGNVVLSDTNNYVFEVSDKGIISQFESTPKAENRRCFLDKLNGFKPNLEGNLKPKPVSGLDAKAQWLEGIGAGAWFELFKTSEKHIYRYRRISPYGNVDVDDNFLINDTTFNYEEDFQFVHFSNCNFFHITQHGTLYRFDKKQN